jgi:uncharacterized membrane protein SpoIIM required for sporulation/uncharacterized RDD family membrane protein YckC
VTGPARVPLETADFRQRHGVETPEHVELRFELAGLGTRVAALAIDTVVVVVAEFLLTLFLMMLFGSESISSMESWTAALLLLVYSFGSIAYFTLCEGLGDGRTLGKRALGIRVVLDTGRPITLGAALVRNIVRIVDLTIPLGPLPGLLLVFFQKSNKRLGDMVAGTIVVRDSATAWRLGAVADAADATVTEPIETGPPDLTEPEFTLLDRFMVRVDELAPDVQARLAAGMARRFEDRIPRRSTDLIGYLTDVLHAEQQKRRGRFATRSTTAGVGRTTVTGERFLARKREAWESFRIVAQRLERIGVGTLPAAEIPGFAARYREVAADLARARTYGLDAQTIQYLERLVSAGHNALYRTRTRRRAPFSRYLLGEFPAAVIRGWAYVLTAFLLFAIPFAVGYVMLRERPQLAEEIVSPVMVSRAEQAADREAEGIGYAETESEERPVVASMIISNNIRVCFWALAGGMLAGIGTVLVLLSNGLSLGTGLGVFANYGAAGYLGTFVAGHGVLELTAIFISGGAGLRLAKALLAPGDRPRFDALIVEGRQAALMIGAVVFLLAIAGSIEGMLSTSDAPVAWKLGVSAATAVFLGLYLINGTRYLRTSAAGTPTTVAG